MKKFDFHDSSITKIECGVSQELTIGIVSAMGNHCRIIFEDALYWEFSPFEMQNVLFDLHIFNQTTLPDYVIDEYEIGEYPIILLKEQNCQIVILNPSVGMGGYIISKCVKMEN